MCIRDSPDTVPHRGFVGPAAGAGIAVCPAVSWLPATLSLRCETRYLLFTRPALSSDIPRRVASDAGDMVLAGFTHRPGNLPAPVLIKPGGQSLVTLRCARDDTHHRVIAWREAFISRLFIISALSSAPHFSSPEVVLRHS